MSRAHPWGSWYPESRSPYATTSAVLIYIIGIACVVASDPVKWLVNDYEQNPSAWTGLYLQD